MARLSETHIPIQLFESKDQGSVGVDSYSVNTGLTNGFSAFFNFGAITGNSILTVYAGASQGAKTTAIGFKYRLSAADCKVALSDQLGDAITVASTGLTLTATTFDHRLVTIEIDPDMMPDGKPYITFSFDSTANPLNVAGFAIARPRQMAHLAGSIVA